MYILCFFMQWGNWDVALRSLPPSVTRNRECICPELNRNKNIGIIGTNMDVELFNRAMGRYTWATDQVSRQVTVCALCLCA